MKYIVEDKSRSSVCLFISTRKRPQRCVRMSFKYSNDQDRENAIKTLNEHRHELAKTEGLLSLAGTRNECLSDLVDDFTIKISPELSSRSLKVALSSIVIVDSGLSSMGLSASQRRALILTGLIDRFGHPTPRMLDLCSSFNEAVASLRGAVFTAQEALSILETIPAEMSGLKAMTIRPTSLIALALIGRGLISTGLLVDALYGERNALSWSICNGYVKRLVKAGLITTSYHSNTNTHDLTVSGRTMLKACYLQS